jgi:hypothetical protein
VAEFCKCRYCGREIIWISKMPYEAKIPTAFENDLEYRMMAKTQPIPHRCTEYLESKGGEVIPKKAVD